MVVVDDAPDDMDLRLLGIGRGGRGGGGGGRMGFVNSGGSANNDS